MSKHTVHILIGINIALFLFAQSGLFNADTAALWPPEHPAYHHWQWLSHMFMHGGLMHLLMNMYALLIFGIPIWQAWGTHRFLMLYFGGGLFGAALYSAWKIYLLETTAAQLANAHGIGRDAFWAALLSNNLTAPLTFLQELNSPVLGASGAVFALLAAFSLRFADAPLSLMFIPIQFRAKYFVAALVVYETFAQISGMSIFGNNIAHLAHIGGALIGWILAWHWLHRSHTRKIQLKIVK